MDDNRSILPVMMIMGIMDMSIIEENIIFIGLAMVSCIPDQYMYDAGSTDMGHDAGH